MTFTDLRNSYKCIYSVYTKEMASLMDPMVFLWFPGAVLVIEAVPFRPLVD